MLVCVDIQDNQQIGISTGSWFLPTWLILDEVTYWSDIHYKRGEGQSSVLSLAVDRSGRGVDGLGTE